MTPLRQRMVEGMQIRNLSPLTQRAYAEHLSRFARHFGRSPAQLGPEEIHQYLVYLTNDRQLSPSSIIITVAALRAVVDRSRDPRTQTTTDRPDRAEPGRSRAVSRQCQTPKHRAILTTCYAAGLRICEAVHLTIPAIDSQRMVLRVDQQKGQKDRYVMLSPKLLDILREWWRVSRPRHWLFPGDHPDEPITTHAVSHVCWRVQRRSGIPKPITAHSLRQRVRRPPPGSRHRRPHDSVAPRTSKSQDHGSVSVPREQ